MSQSKNSKTVLRIRGMSCSSCELKIENALSKVEGVRQVKVSLGKSMAKVEYDPFKVTPEQLAGVIQKLGYEVDLNAKEQSQCFTINQFLGIAIVIFAIYLIIKSTIGFNFIPQVDQSFGYGMLFVVGLLTSLHCIAMCGGINLSQCVCVNQPPEENVSKLEGLKPSLFYNTGRVISYTIIGGLAGALGSVVTFSGAAKGIVSIGAGGVMMLIGIKMLDLFPWLRKFNLSSPKLLGKKISDNHGKLGPFYIGILNGLMPCGPLQTMQIYALGTGSPVAGAAAMFFFSLGTAPLLFGFGAVSSLLSSKFNQRLLKISGVLVIILGLTMVSRGLSLSGIAAPLSGNAGSIAKIEGEVQVVTSKLESGRYYPIVVQKGKPVRWIIQVRAEDLNGCNNPLTIPSLGITKELKPGENLIEFTPEQESKIVYTCWMGMISSYIKVVPDLNAVSETELSKTQDQGYSGGGCCGAGYQAARFAGGRIPVDDLNNIDLRKIKKEIEAYRPAGGGGCCGR